MLNVNPKDTWLIIDEDNNILDKCRTKAFALILAKKLRALNNDPDIKTISKWEYEKNKETD